MIQNEEMNQMMNVLDEYILMLKDVYGAEYPKRKNACKDAGCRMAHRLLKEIQEIADIFRYGTADEQRMMALVLKRNEIIELLMEDLKAYKLNTENDHGKTERINPDENVETIAIKGA